MEIRKSQEGTRLTITLKGRLDTTTAPQLEAEFGFDGVTELVFDISGLDYVSSAGLRLFLSAHKTMLKQGDMKIQGAQPVVKEVFDITGFADILNLV